MKNPRKINFALAAFCLFLSTYTIAAPRFDSVVTLDEISSVSDGLSLKYSGQAFSHDNRLFALFLPGEIDSRQGGDAFSDGRLIVWDTKTGTVKRQAIVPHYFNTYMSGGSFDILFSPDNKMILSSRGGQADILAWRFEEDEPVRVICRAGGRNEFENALQIDSDNVVLIQGINYTSLCGESLKADPYPLNSYSFSGDPRVSSRVLHNNKLLFISGGGSQGLSPGSSKLFDNVGGFPIGHWDIGYVSKARRLVRAIDTKQQAFILLELFNDKISINQWNYATRQRVNQQTFPGLSVPLVKRSDNHHPVYLSENYLLLRLEGNHLTLFKRDGKQFALQWSKSISSLDRASNIYFSLDEAFIVSDSLKLISMSDGSVVNQYLPGEKQQDVVLVEPAIKSVAEKFHTYSPMWEGIISKLTGGKSGGKCSDVDATSSLYSLISNKAIRVVAGEVLAISPDGNILAICKGNKLSLMHNQVVE